MDEASCASTDPDLFFPELDSMWRLQAAKKVCEQCPVIRECLEYALRNRFFDGVWGGLSPNERKMLLRRVGQK